MSLLSFFPKPYYHPPRSRLFTRPFPIPGLSSPFLRPLLGLLRLPLRRRETPGRPGVDPADLLLERAIDQPVPLQRRLALEVGRDDERGEGLAAAAADVEHGGVVDGEF